MNEYLELSEEVKEALDLSKAVVALESTIISHGMPYPRNLETAMDVEETVRSHGAVPATIAVLNGKIKIGLSEAELEHMAKSKNILKLSRMDLPYAISQGFDGATTVAATMICANLANIHVFATGGIGGVHRDAEETMDVSADLFELSKTPVLVVSSGVKSILDIRKTLEYLETLGVTVATYRSDDFPAFYSSSSGFKVNLRVETPQEAASIFKARRALGIDGGMLLANPVSKSDEIPKEKIDTVIEHAIMTAKRKGISGKSVTPFLLSKIVEELPRALDTNIALVKSNAALAAEISKFLI